MNQGKQLSLLVSFIAAYCMLNSACAQNVLDLREERCYLGSDLRDAIQNNRCWIVIDGGIYDLSSDIFWTGKSYEGYKCGDNITSAELAKKNLKLRYLLDYYGDTLYISKIGRLCDKRTIDKPSGCGDERCDVSKENFVNCPQECPPNVGDGLCVPFDDFVCDPDCGRQYDPNCICNADGYCDKEYENHENCPIDCPPDVPDGLCFKRADGLCDPDCSPGEDPDCGPYPPVSTTTTTAQTVSATTIRPSVCGNGICEEGENYLTCRKDCPSGGRDGYCDGVRDRICDPDCFEGDDPDCMITSDVNVSTTTSRTGKQENSTLGYLIYIVPAVILILVVYVIYRRVKSIRE